jgi:hypothetical protein
MVVAYFRSRVSNLLGESDEDHGELYYMGQAPD